MLDPSEPAEGGKVEALAIYDKAVILVVGNYMNKDGKLIEIREPIVVDVDENGEAAKADVIAEFEEVAKNKFADNRLDSDGWEYEDTEYPFDLYNLGQNMYVNAKYANMPINVTYYYRGTDGEVKPVEKQISSNNITTAEDLYKAIMTTGNEVKKDNSSNFTNFNRWLINGTFDDKSPSADIISTKYAEIEVGAEYKDDTKNTRLTPVFTNLYLMEYDDTDKDNEMKYTVNENYNTVYYLEAEYDDDPEGATVVKDYGDKITDAAEADTDEIEGFGEPKFTYDEQERCTVQIANAGDNKYFFAISEALNAEYDNVLITLITPDGSIEQFPIQKGKIYELPEIIDNHEAYWWIEIARAGGDVRKGGTNYLPERGTFYLTLNSVYKLDVESQIEVPSGLEKEDVEKDLLDEALESGIFEDEAQVEYMDASLSKINTTTKEYSEVKGKEFPKGLVVYLPMPNGVKDESKIVVTHMIANSGDVGIDGEAKEVGYVETLKHEIVTVTGADGKKVKMLKITVNSLSPIAIAYEGDAPSGNPDDGNNEPNPTPTPDNGGAGTIDKATNTGDNSNILLPAILALVALAGAGAVVASRRKRSWF